MQDLRAQVTSSLLQFPEVTIQALGEDEITLDSVLHGKFSAGRNGLAWLACGPQLEVVNSVTGERLSAYRFSGVNEQPPTVRVVKEFSWQKRTGLLVGLEEAEGSVLCLYDLGISRVVKAVVLPGRVTAIEPIINHGGASVSTQHLHQSLRWLFGVAAVVTDVGHVLLVDLCLDDLSCSQNEVEASDLEVVSGIPAEVPQRREAVTREGRHLCFQVQNPSGTAISTLCYISRSNLLVVGFSDGYLSLWNMKTLKREYHSQLEGGRIPVYAVTFQEPENDPRNCCYLWAVQSTQESEGDVLSLHLLQLAFGDRKRLASGQVMYEGFEYCDERYSLDLTGGAFPLRGQTSNTKLLSCQTVEKFRNHIDREDSVNEVISPDTSVSVFSWQVNTYGQGKPSTYLGVFDINRWYHAQMPDSLRPEEFLHNCPYFALWSLDAVTNVTSPNLILDVLVHERSLSRGVPPSYPPPEQFFNPSTYNFDGTCLLNSGVVHMTCTGFQKETLNFLKESGPSISEAICDSYNRCLVAGLLSPRLVDVQPSSLSQEEQLEAVLSAAVQTSSLELLTGYIKYWTSEEQPSSAASLRFVLEWTWNKVIYTKEEFDQICVPLFDGSCNFIDPQTMQSLQHCQLLFSNLSTVLNCFLTEARELTEKGVTDLTNKQVVTSLISLYAQVVIWFCRSSLLPEGLDDDMHLSRPFYNYPLIQSYYTSHRQKLERLSRGRWDSDCLMIDGMVSQLGEQAEKLWRRDEGGTGKYPPASLHALLDLYLLENIEENYKHAITIYLLLDIMHSFPNKTETSIDSFPTVFAIPWGLVKLIQGFWLLDHNDFENSLALLFHPATIKTVPWQHMRIIQSLMCQGEHRRALRYMQMMNPSMSSSSEVQLFLTVLLSNRCMVEAWSLLQKHSTKLNVEELLKQVYEICQEMGLMEDLLKLPFTDTEQECLEKFLQTNGGTQNREFLLVHHLQRANYIPALQLNHSMKVNLTNDRDPRLRERAVARNSILDQYGKILPRVQRKLALERAKPYRLPSSVFREVSRPKPLSTVAKQVNAGNVHTRATFISNVLSKIGEVWVGNEQKTSFSQCDSPRVAEPPVITHPLPDAELPDAFVGTPITKLSQKCSRLLDLVVRPVPSCSPAQNESWQSPCLPSTSYMESSSLKSNIHGSSSQKKISRASELNLLETPLVVKRAKVLVTSSSASGFAGFTPQSILRSSLRTTPLATPSASPGRSVTPPLRAKEPRISFRDVNSNAKWTVGVTGNEKAQSGASSEHCRGLVEDNWSGSRDKASLFTLSNTEDDPAEMEESLESVPGDGLEKMDVSKENSNVSVKSDQTTLEYHDAKSPSDFEDDVIFIAAKPASSFTEEPADFQEPAKENNEIIEDELFQVEHTHSSEVGKEAGFLEEATPECPTLPKDGKLVFKAAEGVTSWTSREDETVHEEPKITTASEEKDTVTVKNPQLSEFPEADNESVISVLDSEDVIRTRSENRPEERLVDVPEELNLENEAEVNASFPQEEMHNSNNLPKTEEMNVLDEDIAVKAQTSEESPETSPCSELHPTGNLQYNYDTIEQQFAYDLPDNKDGECYAVEGDGELFISQSNFTLVLEGEEGEGEMGDLALADASKAAVTTTDERPVNSLGSTENEEHVTNSVSTVTSDQESQNIAESLPYVPEPIKVAIAENLLDVIKDTRSKEFTSEVVEQSIHESIGKKVTRFRKSKTPLTPVPEAADDESSIHQVEYVVTPRTRARRQLSRTLIIPSADDEQVLKTDKPVLFGLSPRRSTRQTKAYETSSLVTVENTQDEQISVIPATPKRRGRKPKQTNLEKVESSQSDGQVLSSSTQSIAVTPRRLRRAKEAASELLEDANEETSLAEGTVIASTTSRRTRGGKTSAGDQETGQSSTDHRIKMAVSPSRGARKLKSSSSPLVENTIMDQELQPGDQPLLPGPAKRGRKIKMSSSDVSENSDLDLSKSSLPQTELKLPVTPRRSARKAAQNLSADVESVSVRENLPSGGEVEILDTPRRRTRKVAQAKPEKTDTIEKTPEQPNEQSTTPRTTIRSGFRGRKRQLPSILEETTREEVFPEGTDGSPLLLTDINASGYDETSRTVTDRVRRNRSRKTSMHQDLPVEENESFFFSPPLTKLTKKFKAGKADQHVQDLDPDLSSQFVFSPPLLRSRRKNVSSTPHTVEEPELPTKEEEEIKSIESLGKQKLKRGRPARSKVKKASKTTRKEVSWSPPPVEINFISPFGTPVDEMRSKQKETTDVTEKTVRKNKKRLSNFPKPVVRRKML